MFWFEEKYVLQISGLMTKSLFFNWSEEYINEIAKKVNCTVNEISWDHDENDKEVRWGNRLYSEWTKQAFNT